MRTRQPLARALVAAAGWEQLPRDLVAEVADELNVAELTEIGTVGGDLVDVSVKVDFRAVGRRLGIALAPVVSALNLSEVVLSGPPELLDGPLRECALATLQERTIPVISSDLQLRMTPLGEDGTLLGAAVLVLSGQLGFS